MKSKKPVRTTRTGSDRTREPARKNRQRDSRRSSREAKRATLEAAPRGRQNIRDTRPDRSAPRTTPTSRPADGPVRPKSASQAKARSKARKAKAPKVVRPPLRQRILVRLASIDLNPRRLITRVPFVVLVISALGLGLGVTLWLSTDAAERSYQLGAARAVNQALMQQKEALERDVLQAQAAPALAEAARELGMIPSRDTARLIQDPAGHWVVVGTPKPADGVPPPPLNVPLPEPEPPAPPAPRVVEPREVPVRLPSAQPPAAGLLPVPLAVPGVEVPHAVSGGLPGPVPGQQPPALEAPIAAGEAAAAPLGADLAVPPPPAVPSLPEHSAPVAPAVPGPPA
ncbi:hypothetical protein [Mycobacterium sp. SMC-4]|uniref:hypothetical protein n=1 Tax=Mycobacterium sp. SMC-4 TaxID=2857059 RepID=UPI0021B26068|nr:hypothetical protein [Mycobacterium sp. SMC-4]UXA16230.1 hypothetical protein KXD98_15425 [Mycobacterium sp. SMC-4]